MYLLADPNEVLPMTFDWSAVMGSANFTSSTWLSDPAGLTFNNESTNNTTKKSTAYYSGGTAGQDYRIINRVVFNSTTAEQSIDVRFENR